MQVKHEFIYCLPFKYKHIFPVFFKMCQWKESQFSTSKTTIIIFFFSNEAMYFTSHSCSIYEVYKAMPAINNIDQQ